MTAQAVRLLTLADMAAAAAVHRASYDTALPWLAGRHTPAEDTRYFRNNLFPSCALWGAFDAGDRMVGVIAFRDGWIDQLYVVPAAQHQGVGTTLLEIPRKSQNQLRLWTFQRNQSARRFYEARGFVLVRETDGAENFEREPDALYRWRR